MSQIHPFIPADWQRKASILLLPLEPQPYFFDTGGGLWGNVVFAKIEDILLEALEYYPGDRIYFKEKWCEYDSDEAKWLDWQPAGTMPIVAAKEWREIKTVKLFEAEKLTVGMFAKSGLESFSAVAPKWDNQFLDYPWTPDLWIVALEVAPL